MCGWKGHISKDCPRRVRMAMQASGSNKNKDRMGQGQEERRMGQGPEERRMSPNERGWVEKTKYIFNYTKSVEETIQEMGNTGGPSRMRY